MSRPTNRLITCAALAALGFASTVPAQERERRVDRLERERGGQAQSSQQPSQSTTRPASYGDRYAILERNNIFVRDRSRAASRPSNASASTQPTRRSTEESLIVRGIAMEELGYRAYVEDLNGNATLRISPGDALGRGKVVAVAIDAIQYEQQDGKRTWIEVGSDLTGKQSIASSSAYASSSSSASTSPTTLPANVDLNDPSLTVEQRMRLRVQLQQQRGR